MKRIVWSTQAAMSVFALAAPVSAFPAPPMQSGADIFIGTLERDGGDIILRRCDAAENRYVLVDAPGATALAAVRKSALPAYGEVLASYTEKGGRSILTVEHIDALTPGRNCHLLDALNDLAKDPVGPDALRAQLAVYMLAASAKMRGRDYPGAVTALRQAQTFIASNRNTLTTAEDAIGFADIATSYGDVLKTGRLGDPCPHYALARTEGLRAIGAGGGASEVRTVLERIDRKAVNAACPARGAAQPDVTFVGHYYLSGVRETGSELLLSADGNFQWFLAYGAVDQSAKGTWHRDGDAIVLTADTPKTDAPLFAYLETEPWSAKAEEELRARQNEAQVAAVRAACPFLTDLWVSSPTSPLVYGEQVKPPADVLLRNAADKRAKAIDLRTRVELLARQVMGSGAAQVSDEHAAQAQKLLSDWLDAKEQARRAARAAGLPDPAFGDPALPRTCTIPPVKEVDPDAPATWQGGLGVRVFDIAGEQGASEVHVRLRFADGREEEVVTARRGLGLRMRKLDKAVVGATLSAAYAKGRDARFTFAPVTKGILHFSIDAKQLAEVPFTTLRLKISGQALIPEEFGRGRYERQP